MTDFFEIIELNNNVKPINKKIDKKLLFEQIDLNTTDKKIISEFIEKILIVSVLNKYNVNIQPYTDDEIIYESVLFINVEFRKKEKIQRIAELLNYAIPNPIVLVFSYKDEILISTAQKRLNKVDKNKAVFSIINLTNWIDLNKITNMEQKFIDSLKFHNLPFTTFYDFYTYIDDAVYVLSNIEFFNDFRMFDNFEEKEKIKSQIEEVKVLEEELANIKNMIKNESQFNKKAEYNIKATQLRDEIISLKNQIKTRW